MTGVHNRAGSPQTARRPDHAAAAGANVVRDRATRPASTLEVPVSRLTTAPGRLSARLAQPLADGDAGMATAEYAVATVAACGFGGILFKVITSPEVLGLLRDVISAAFKLSF